MPLPRARPAPRWAEIPTAATNNKVTASSRVIRTVTAVLTDSMALTRSVSGLALAATSRVTASRAQAIPAPTARSIVFIEAMATGLPAIGTICGGPEDIITPESGFLIRPGDVDALAAKMKTLYDTYESFDKEKIRQSIVSRFDFQLAGQKLRQVYSEALEMSKPPKASES